jgi:hypothetical protein
MAKKHQQALNSTHLGSVFVKEEDNFVHSYELYHQETLDTTIIKYAEGKLWDREIQGSTAGSVFDNGDIVTINVGSSTIHLDYADMEVLTALIMACNDTEMEFRKYIVSSSIKPI